RADPVVGLGHDLHVGLAVDQHLQPGADDPVVVRDQHPDHVGTRKVIVVPPPGAERTSRSPPTSRARSAMPTSPRPGPRTAGAEPRPSSLTRSSTPSSSVSTPSSTTVAPAWRVTFVSASWAT